MRQGISVSRKLIGMVLLILLAGFGALAWFVDRGAESALVAQAVGDLEAVRTSRKHFVESTLERKVGAVRLIGDAILIKTMLKEMPEAFRERASGRPARYEALHKTFHNPALQWMEVFGWYDVFLVATDGTIVYSARKEPDFGTNLYTGPYSVSPLGDAFRRVIWAPTSKDAQLVDFSLYPPSAGVPASFIGAPAAGNPGGGLLGVFAVQLSTAEFDAIMTDRTGLKNTGETYLIGSDKLMRTNSRFGSDTSILKQRIETAAATRAINGESGTIVQRDYRDHDVLSSFAPLTLQGVRWAILAEVDLAEVLIPAKALRVRIFQLFAAIAALTGLLLVVVLRRVVLRPVGALSAGAARVARKNFNEPVSVGSRDELGQLADTMNQMMTAVGDHVTDVERSRAYLEEILNTTPIGVGISVDGICRLANPMYRRMFGATVGEPVVDRFLDPNDQLHIVEQVRRHGILRDFLSKAHGANDEVLDILGTFYRIEFDGKPGVLGWLVDVTKMKQLQTDLEQRYADLQRLRSLQDSLVHMIVHDLRAPLTSVMGYLDLATSDPRISDANRTLFIAEASDGASRMAEMISSVLDVSRLEAGEMPLDRHACELGELAADALKQLGGLAVGRDVTLRRPRGPVQAYCDAGLITRAIGNFLGNALKFSPQSGSIAVTVTQNVDRPRVEVADTGPGIPADALERIFEKFGQSHAGQAEKRHSSGLGLAFCKLAIEAHAGTIGVTSTVGAGTTFWFELPPAKRYRDSSGPREPGS